VFSATYLKLDAGQLRDEFTVKRFLMAIMHFTKYQACAMSED